MKKEVTGGRRQFHLIHPITHNDKRVIILGLCNKIRSDLAQIGSRNTSIYLISK